MEEENLEGRESLKDKFKNGDRPNQTDFSDLIDSTINQESDKLFAVNRKIGIGTDKPSATLEVRGGRRKVKQSFLTSDGDCSTFRIAHPHHGTVGIGTNDAEKLALGTFAKDGSAFKSHMTLDPDGNIGVGTISPRERIDVRGSISVSERIHLGESILEFVNGRLLLIYGGRKYEIEMHHTHRHPAPPPPPRRRGLLWVLISLGILLVIGIAVVIYLLIK